MQNRLLSICVRNSGNGTGGCSEKRTHKNKGRRGDGLLGRSNKHLKSLPTPAERIRHRDAGALMAEVEDRADAGDDPPETEPRGHRA